IHAPVHRTACQHRAQTKQESLRSGLSELHSQGRPKAASACEGRNESPLTTFVDTSVWFASANIRDGQNARAKAILAGVVEPLLTDHVLVETWNLINARIHRHAAERFWL